MTCCVRIDACLIFPCFDKPWSLHLHGMVRSSKKAKREVEVEQLRALRVQEELAVFGDGYKRRTQEELGEPEVWWSEHYQWFKDNGYLLRPRYAPGWVPSWKGNKKDRLLCEDGRASRVYSALRIIIQLLSHHSTAFCNTRCDSSLRRCIRYSQGGQGSRTSSRSRNWTIFLF